eukprot:367017-Pelagomonas_calceolata.AAC.1
MGPWPAISFGGGRGCWVQLAGLDASRGILGGGLCLLKRGLVILGLMGRLVRRLRRGVCTLWFCSSTATTQLIYHACSACTDALPVLRQEDAEHVCGSGVELQAHARCELVGAVQQSLMHPRPVRVRVSFAVWAAPQPRLASHALQQQRASLHMSTCTQHEGSIKCKH